MLKEFNLNYILNNDYDYFFIAKKPIYSLLNEKNKITYFDIVTNMPLQMIKEFDGDRTIIRDRNESILLIEKDVFYNFYHYDFDNIENIKDRLFDWQNFTIDMIYETCDGEFLDYEYKYRNKKVQAIKDVEYKQIRLLNINKNSLIEKPEQILQAFSYMSEYGFEIEPQTLTCISKNVEALSNVNLVQLKLHLKNLLYGKNVVKTIELMKSLNIFDVTIKDKNGNDTAFLHEFKEMDFTQLESVNNKFHLNWIETITLIFNNHRDQLDYLESIDLINHDELKKITWLIEQFGLIDEEDYRTALFNARNGIVAENGLMQMKELLNDLTKIYNRIYDDRKEDIERIIFDFRRRPYFKNQIKADDNVFVEIANDDDEDLINLAKEKLLYKLIMTDKFPKEMTDYMEYVNESVEEAVSEKMMADIGLLGK